MPLKGWAAILALVGVGLLASLLPPAGYIIESTGDPYATLTPVLPGSGLRQQLGKLTGPVLTARIWMAASKDGEAVHIEASLVRNGTETIRQFSTRAEPAVKPRVHVFHFEPYETSPNDELELEVAALPNQASFVIFGIAKSETAFSQVTVNGTPLDFQGPLAYELAGQRSGVRAALSGAADESVRFYGAIAALAFSAFLVLLGPKVATRLIRLVNRPHSSATELDRRRWLYYPWLIAAYPILYFYSNNIFVFGVLEIFLPIVATWAIVAMVVLILRFVTGSMGSGALITAIGSSIFLSFGHLQGALGERADPRVLLPVAVVIQLAAALWLWNRGVFAARAGRYLNLVSVVLILVPLVSVGSSLADRYLNQIESGGAEAAAITSNASTFLPAIVELGRLPDIYYIILDNYPRADAMPGFDNSPFLEGLAQRGFYVPSGAISNYHTTQLSIPSSTNFRYLSEFSSRGSKVIPAIHGLTADHALGRTLRALDYTYVHMNSGFAPTDNPSNADLVVDFTPSQITYRGPRSKNPFAVLFQLPSSRRFLQELLPTTILRPFLPSLPLSPDTPFDWGHPQRTLAMVRFLKTVPAMHASTFTFAHIVKPHNPFTFDQYGNISYPEGWSNEHDPTVPSNFHGQLLYVNDLVIEIVDALIFDSDSPPIIVITADHGAGLGRDGHKILAAYYLPYGGNSVLYPTISSVNSFRVVLDYYFGLKLGLLDDNIYLHTDGEEWFEFQESPITIGRD